MIGVSEIGDGTKNLFTEILFIFTLYYNIVYTKYTV